MNKQFQKSINPSDVTPLTTSEQCQIKGGMAASEEEKHKKSKKNHR